MKRFYFLMLLAICHFTTFSQNNAIDLSGTSNYVSVSNTYGLNSTAFTVEFDFYMNALQNFNAGVTNTSGNIPNPIDFYVPSSGVVNLILGNGSSFESVTGTPTLNASQWYHIAITVDDTAKIVKLYIDGVESVDYTYTVNLSFSNNLLIGDRADAATNANASFDNVRIWSVVRTALEISNNYTSCLVGDETGLDVYYTFENITGGVVQDLATNNSTQNGTIVGTSSDTTGTGCTVVVTETDPPTTNYTTQVYTGDDKTLADLQVTGTNIKWYDAATAGTLLSSTDGLVDETTYYASQTISGIESTERVAITANRISDNAQTFASGSTVADLVATPSTNTTAQWFTSASGGTALDDASALTNGIYYVEQLLPETIVSLGSDFSFPAGVAVESNGKILVADTFNDVIKRMDEDGSNIVTLGSGFSRPYRVEIQPDGKILVADTFNNAIKRMDADGSNIVTLGSGFNSPYDVTLLPNGKILVADTNNNAIKRMDADGTNIEILGDGFNFPLGVAVQPDGKILVADYDNFVIKRMDADGTNIVTISNFSTLGIAVQQDGKILFTDNNNNNIKRMNADGSNIEIIGSDLSNPSYIELELDGNILVADSGNNAIKRISLTTATNRVPVAINLITEAPTTNYVTQVYTGDDKTLVNLQVTGTNIQWYDATTAGTLLPPTTLLIDETTYHASQTVSGVESTERVAITVNRISDNVQEFASGSTVADLMTTPSTSTTAQWFTSASGGTALDDASALTNGIYYVEQFAPETITTLGSDFNLPFDALIQPDGKILVADSDNNAIKRMDADGSNIVTLASGFNSPRGITLLPDGKILVADTGNNAIKRMDADGSNIVILGTGFNIPFSVSLQSDGKILVADTGNNAIKRMDADGSNIVTLATEFAFPGKVIELPDNKILIADTFHDAIRRMDADGTNIIDLGIGFQRPLGVVVKPSGKILVADFFNDAVKEMDADGSNIVTLNNTFNRPTDIVIETNDNILVVDSNNNHIKRLSSETISNRVPVTINIVTEAPTTAYSTQVYTGDDKTLADLQVTGTAIKWYDAITGGTLLSSADLLIDETTYYASQTIGGVESTERLAITLNRISDNMQAFVPGNTVADLVATPSTGATAYWFTSDTGGTALESTYGLTNGTYYVEQSLAEVTTEALGSEFSNHKSLAVQLNGKILIAEYFNGVIKRMDADGSNIVTLSSEFNSPSAIAVQSDGKILVLEAGGSSIKRMNSDGTNIVMLGAGFNNPQDFAVQPDGKILILDGDYGNYLIKRMNADGTNIVTLLETGFFSSYISHIAVQPDGKILITDESNGTIIRMNADGSNMVTVFTESNTDNFVYDDLILTPDGKILFAQEDQFNGIYYINRMDLDGMNHESIVFGGLIDMALQLDGKILFVDFSNTHVTRIISLATQSNRVPVIVDETLSVTAFEEDKLVIYPNPSTGIFNIKTTENLNIKVYDLTGKLVHTGKVASGNSEINMTNLTSGMYMLHAINEDNASKHYKIIKE